MIVSSMYLLYKKPNETCLECITRLKNNLISKGEDIISLTYAGRLDPLASGLLIALKDGEIAHKEEMLNLPKTYDIEVLFDFATDSFDLLGVLHPSESFLTWRTLISDQDNINSFSKKDKENLKNDIVELKKILINSENKKVDQKIDVINSTLEKIIGDIEIAYPFFSSQPIGGKPLFQYIKENGIEKTNSVLPLKKTSLQKVTLVSARLISTNEVVQSALTIVDKMQNKGEFRQDEIASMWKEVESNTLENMKKTSGDKHLMLRFRISCGSGFYVRSFATWIGQIVGQGALAFSILRTSIGLYFLTDDEVIS